MSRGFTRHALLPAAAGMILLLGGCAYDYVNHEDRVSYSAGDAVAANLIQETINPEKPSMYYKKGLGKNGKVIPGPTTQTKVAATTVSSTSTTTNP